MKVNCPACGQEEDVNGAQYNAGKDIECPHCKAKFHLNTSTKTAEITQPSPTSSGT